MVLKFCLKVLLLFFEQWSRMGCLQSSEGKKDKGSAESNRSEAPKTVDPRLPFETYRQLFNLKNSWKAISRKLEDTAKDNLLRYLYDDSLEPFCISWLLLSETQEHK